MIPSELKTLSPLHPHLNRHIVITLQKALSFLCYILRACFLLLRWTHSETFLQDSGICEQIHSLSRYFEVLHSLYFYWASLDPKDTTLPILNQDDFCEFCEVCFVPYPYVFRLFRISDMVLSGSSKYSWSISYQAPSLKIPFCQVLVSSFPVYTAICSI